MGARRGRSLRAVVEMSRFTKMSIMPMRARAVAGTAGLAAIALALAPVGVPPVAAVTTPYAYVTNSASNTVSVVNTYTNMVVSTVGVGARRSESPSLEFLIRQPFGTPIATDVGGASNGYPYSQ
jgi:YVTN family beta-propeller protein